MQVGDTVKRLGAGHAPGYHRGFKFRIKSLLKIGGIPHAKDREGRAHRIDGLEMVETFEAFVARSKGFTYPLSGDREPTSARHYPSHIIEKREII